MMPARQHGAVLLVVSLLMATIAALAFGLNRASVTEVRSVQGDYEARAAAYLAEAAIADAKWTSQVKDCKAVGVTPKQLGVGSYMATVNKPGSRDPDITATGTVGAGQLAGSAVRTIERKKVILIDYAKGYRTDLIGVDVDTTIAASSTNPDSGNQFLSLSSVPANQAHALLTLPTHSFNRDTRVISATLRLALSDSFPVARAVAIHRLTTPWEPDATWTRAKRDVAWTAGGDYSSAVMASAEVSGAGLYRIDITDLVDGWVSGRVVNQGVLLRLSAPGQTATFYSRDTSSSTQRPVLEIVSARPC